MGVDWSRIMPKQPMDGLKEIVNVAALERYKWIIHRVRSYGMKVIPTLFHHSLPPWARAYGGWKLERTIGYFMDFTRVVVGSVSNVVDYWVTFNAPHVFCLLTYCADAWPGGHPDALELMGLLSSTTPVGWLNRMIQFKEKSSKVEDKNVRVTLLLSPIQMASDILIYQFDFVPVDEDPKQPLELTREMAERDNYLYRGRKWMKMGGKGGTICKRPVPLIPPAGVQVMFLSASLSKISKSPLSDQSRINLRDPKDTIAT
ncbi:hypothetical protein Nepgr_031038 [Nepenthes gracilis]|uniref:Uncharacterized protein n=1 Tax=Nepenthes gracilis TaxID=150966 RepID=A0AAD3TFP3_NEPGR|nr:hypothetical protein Nepgr_031038 [Nepenthes gracilis]